MVAKVTGGKGLPLEVLQQIVSKTDGVPLFVEELTKMVLESGLLREEDSRYVGAHGSAPIPPLAIPSTLQDSLMARLDRLATGREIVQIGATLGREFDYAVLQAVSPLHEDTLQLGLRQLVETELVYQSGVPPQARYLFKHALIRDTAYQSLLKSRRQQLHQQVAQVLEARFAETAESQPELVAHHYTEAGLVEQAIPYWQQAGKRAVDRSAYSEAVSHFTKGIALLSTLPDTQERAQYELSLQIALGTPLIALKGHGAPEVEGVYSRARDLCQQVGETPQLFPVLLGLRRFYQAQGEMGTAYELGERLLRLAQNLQDRVLLARAHMMLGETLYASGEFLQARAYAEQGFALYDRQQHHSHTLIYGTDTGVGCLCYIAHVLWYLGHPAQALAYIHKALVLAQELSHPFSMAMALLSTALLHQLRQEGPAAQKWAETVLRLATGQEFALYLAWGTSIRGWALTKQGQEEEGIAQLQQGLNAYQAMGAEMLRPLFLIPLAGAYGKVGRREEGLGLLAEALATLHKRNGGSVEEAELYRLKGELLLAQTLENQIEAETCFQQAITVARRQSAKSMELRAVISLSRLRQQQGKQNEAHTMLSEIYSWFTEGFDTKDLQEAKALLVELT